MSAVILVGVFLVSPGFFLIDEAIYHLGARTIAESGTLGLDNGYQRFRSESLKLHLLVDGPQGLTPQYPPGSALLAAPLLPLLGPRAFILLNALAAIATLFTVWTICLSQFKSKEVAQIAVGLLVAGTFWMEYALGIWPHAISTFCAVQAYWLALRHLDFDGKNYRPAILAGFLAGLGVLFRLDAILAVPAIGLMLTLFAPNILRSLFWFGTGVLPSLAVMVVLNTLKFGSPNPLSYGQSGGNVHLATYGAYFAALCLVFALLLLIRKTGWKIRRKRAIGATLLLCFALFLIPATRPWIMQFWNGFRALVLDMRTVVDDRQMVQPGPGETVHFYGYAKAALGQSLPWMGLMAILLTGKIQPRKRRTIATLAISIAVFTLPFIWLSWHGGGGSNMRYFLPALPAISILCATLFRDLWLSVPNAMLFLRFGLWVGLAVIAAWTAWHPSGFGGVRQIVSTSVFLVTVMAAALSGVPRRFQQYMQRLTLAVFSAGFVMAFSFAAFDFGAAEKRRAITFRMSEMVERLPPKSLIITRAEWVGAWIPGDGVIAATRDATREQIDARLAEDALDQGYRVFLVDFDILLEVPPGLQASDPIFLFPKGRAIELSRQKR